MLSCAKASSSSWLSVVLLESHQFDLACQEFHDALTLRYRKPLLGLPPYCDGCGSPFNVDRALDNWVGGLVGRRHNEVRDAIGDLASLVWGQVQRKPIVCEATIDGTCDETLIADLWIRGVWQPQVDAVFDCYLNNYKPDAVRIGIANALELIFVVYIITLELDFNL